jgi:heme-degrading monooxygenase HmoA
VNSQNVFFTYSIWDSEDHLYQYRKSVTFKEIWSKTKPLFCNKAKAWSVEEI